MIEIGKGYYIKVDPYNFVLCEEIKKDGEIVMEELTYHQDLRGVLNSFVKKYAKKTMPKNYDELVKIEKEISDTIKRKKNITVSALKKEWSDMQEKNSKKGNKIKKKK